MPLLGYILFWLVIVVGFFCTLFLSFGPKDRRLEYTVARLGIGAAVGASAYIVLVIAP